LKNVLAKDAYFTAAAVIQTVNSLFGKNPQGRNAPNVAVYWFSLEKIKFVALTKIAASKKALKSLHYLTK
jgi:hypothetical protein